jgi:two-component system, NtrC family, response regulator HydG
MATEPKKTRILVVDDAPETLEVLERNLASRGYQVLTATAVAAAVALLERRRVDVVITDLKMPGRSGLELVRYVRDNCRDTEVLMITGYPSVDAAVQAFKNGAEEFLCKPFTDEELFEAVRQALVRLQARRASRGRPRPESALVAGLVGESPAMREVAASVRKAAASAAPVLIRGETGVGKEVVARAIHYGGAGAAGPFVAVNVAAIPPEHLERELFGSTARDGAAARTGLFHASRGGTIFVDEVAGLGAAAQAGLGRVLDHRAVLRVGSARSEKLDVRVIGATSRDLAALCASGRLSQNLAYSLRVVEIALPPLRERGDDILLIARSYAARFAAELGREPPSFSERALLALRGYAWPGNVRELQNLVHRLVVMTEGGEIDIPDLPAPMRFGTLKADLPLRTLAAMEVDYIRRVLEGVDGNRTRAAEILGIDRKTLREKLQRAGRR